MKKYKNRKYYKKTIKNNKIHSGGGSEQPMNLQDLTQKDIETLMQQGIMPEQLAAMSQEQGQPIPPIIQQMMDAGIQQPGTEQPRPEQLQLQNAPQTTQSNTKVSKKSRTSKYPAMLSLAEYANYLQDDKLDKQDKLEQEQSQQGIQGYQGYQEQEQQQQTQRNSYKHKNKYTDNGYMFSNLITEQGLRDIKRTQGSFLVGVNLNNLYNTFSKIIKNINTRNNSKTQKKPNTPANTFIDSDTIFKQIGEFINVDFDKTLEHKMGFRGSDVSQLPEIQITNNSTFYDIIKESKKYADTGYGNNITPAGLLIMTRMLYKYRKNNEQWIRVATILELIYKYFGNAETREEFFKNTNDISILSLMELEEFYNTDHIFMSDDELITFKKDLDYYKYDTNVDITKKLQTLLSKPPPII